MALHNFVRSSLIGAEFSTRIKGAQQVGFFQEYLKYYCMAGLFLSIKLFFATCSFSLFLTFSCTQFSLMLLIFFLSVKVWPFDTG